MHGQHSAPRPRAQPEMTRTSCIRTPPVDSAAGQHAAAASSGAVDHADEGTAAEDMDATIAKGLGLSIYSC